MKTKARLALGAALLAFSVCGSGCGVLLGSIWAEAEYGDASLGVPVGLAIDVVAGVAVAESVGDGEGVVLGVLTSALLIGIDFAVISSFADGAGPPGADASFYTSPAEPDGAPEVDAPSLNFALGRDEPLVWAVESWGPVPAGRTRAPP